MNSSVAPAVRHDPRLPAAFRLAKAMIRRDVRGAWSLMQWMDRMGLLRRACTVPFMDSTLQVPLDWRWFWQHDRLADYEPTSLRCFAHLVKLHASGPAVLFDCGAHIGLVSNYLARACSGVIDRVVCFEPDATWRSTLQANCDALPVAATLIPKGVGSFTGRARLLKPDGLEDGGYLVPDGNGTIEVMRIDDLSLPPRHGVVMKIDVEGAELEVLRGAAQHLRDAPFFVQEVNQALADSFKLDKPEGALVSNVDPNGPAAKAGLQAGDVIRQVNGQAVVASGDLPAIIGQAMPGQQVSIDIWRQGQPQQLTAKLADANARAAQVAAGGDDPTGAQDKQARLGLALRPLQPQERRGSGMGSMAGGLVVENASGPAARAGVQPGDVLVAVNGTPVQTAEQVKEAVGKSGKSAALLIVRDGNRIFVPVRLG